MWVGSMACLIKVDPMEQFGHHDHEVYMSVEPVASLTFDFATSSMLIVVEMDSKISIATLQWANMSSSWAA